MSSRRSRVAHVPDTGTRTFKPADFARVRDFVRVETGIELGTEKQVLVYSRLSPRLRELKLDDCRAYLEFVARPEAKDEKKRAIHALTTHETFFFREDSHFEFLQKWLAERPERSLFRAWSAACSTGEEVWTLAMTLSLALPSRPWELVGTDVSAPAVETASQGLYPLKCAEDVPAPLLKRFFLKGTGEHEGKMLVSRELHGRARFAVANLCQPQPTLGQFDVVLVRNVLIYFQPKEKLNILRNVLDQLRPGGLLITGHSEGLAGLSLPLENVAPSVHRKPLKAP